MSDYIICGKLDNKISLKSNENNSANKVRLHCKKLIRQKECEFLSISANEHSIWFEKQLWSFESFFSMTVKKKVQRLIVLTNKENLFIIEQATTHGLSVDVFEVNFPIFPNVKYNSNIRLNLDVLNKYQQKINYFGFVTNTLSKDLANQHLRTTVKKINFKNSHDKKFFLAYKDSYQEVFKLKDERPDRTIIALDFNSMYVDSMKGDFCDPLSIEYTDFRGETAPFHLFNGIYRVRLISAKSSFLRSYHPFLYKRLGRSFYFQMEVGDTIETLLFKNEIDYFSSFFDHLEVIEGFCSSKSIEHPLFKKGHDLYLERMYHRRRGDKIRENLCKVSMQHLHSSTNQKQYSTKIFRNLTQIRDFLTIEFAMNLDEVSCDQMIEFLTHHKYFKISKNKCGYELSYINTDGRSTIFSLSAQIVANARLKIIKTLETFLSHPTVEICYSNVDSIHLSIRRNEVSAFFSKYSDMISDQLGALKIEAIADKGYWFDIGRYWLLKDEKVVLFKNKGFNHKAASTEFVCRRKVSSLVTTPTFSLLNTFIAKLENSFNYSKKLTQVTSQESNYLRFQYKEIESLHSANMTEAHEQLRSKRVKIHLFKHISSA